MLGDQGESEYSEMSVRGVVAGGKSISALTLDRLNGLTDGVVAIVLTLLVLGIDIPS